MVQKWLKLTNNGQIGQGKGPALNPSGSLEERGRGDWIASGDNPLAPHEGEGEGRAIGDNPLVVAKGRGEDQVRVSGKKTQVLPEVKG
jgi:hypothetical protein